MSKFPDYKTVSVDSLIPYARNSRTRGCKEAKVGKPPHAPTPESRAQVSALYSYGITQEEIARFLSIDPKTLRLHYRDELDSAHVKANAKVGQFLFQNASGATLKDGATHSDCVRAAMFWAKTRMGWRESSQVDHTSSDGSMSPTRIELVVPSKE